MPKTKAEYNAYMREYMRKRRKVWAQTTDYLARERERIAAYRGKKRGTR
jgi:hypothetical protein